MTLTYNEQQRKVREQQAAEYKDFVAKLSDKARKNERELIERAAANHEAAEAERQHAAEVARIVEHEATLKAALRASYVAANGTATGFEIHYPRLRSAYVEQQALANVQVEPATANYAEKFIKAAYRR